MRRAAAPHQHRQNGGSQRVSTPHMSPSICGNSSPKPTVPNSPIPLASLRRQRRKALHRSQIRIARRASIVKKLGQIQKVKTKLGGRIEVLPHL